jgi:aryl-alcohol dehydrogenase-like predicted oxidoreductase
MNTLHLPQLKRDVSRLGLGSDWFSPERKDEVFAVLDAFHAAGGNLIDTGEVYGGGKSERTLGDWVAARGNRSQVVILDKGCHHPQYPFGPEAMRESITRCLEKLQTDYLDLWAFHRDNPEEPVGPLLDTLNGEVEAGRIRAFGCSNWSTARVAEANEYAAGHGMMGLAFASPNVSLAIPREPFWEGCTHATEEDLAWHAKTGLPLVAWSSQGRGFFLDRSGPGDQSDPDVVRVYHTPDNFERLARARKLAADKGVTAIQIALAYVLNLPAPTLALIGPHTVDELASSTAALEIALSDAEMAWLALKT